MNFQKLEKNILDVMTEQQIKLGYRSETVRLYYPLVSLNRFLGTEYDEKEMSDALIIFAKEMEVRWGMIQVSHRDGRFCLAIPPRGAAYAHTHMGENGFLQDFIRTIEKHDCTIDDILEQFHRYSGNVHMEKVNNGEFDYLIYFEDGKPDDYRYCITDEDCHMLYHRFTVDDYNDFGF